MDGLVLATVGTTKFDDLIEALDDLKVLQALYDKGFRDLLVQKGNGDHSIRNIHPSPIPDFNVRCVWFCLF